MIKKVIEAGASVFETEPINGVSIPKKLPPTGRLVVKLPVKFPRDDPFHTLVKFHPAEYNGTGGKVIRMFVEEFVLSFSK